jgi:hypothetical protein
MCKGTNQFVHRDCLDHWRSVKVNYIDARFYLFLTSSSLIFLFCAHCQAITPLAGFHLVLSSDICRCQCMLGASSLQQTQVRVGNQKNEQFG